MHSNFHNFCVAATAARLSTTWNPTFRVAALRFMRGYRTLVTAVTCGGSRFQYSSPACSGAQRRGMWGLKAKKIRAAEAAKGTNAFRKMTNYFF